MAHEGSRALPFRPGQRKNIFGANLKEETACLLQAEVHVKALIEVNWGEKADGLKMGCSVLAFPSLFTHQPSFKKPLSCKSWLCGWYERASGMQGARQDCDLTSRKGIGRDGTSSKWRADKACQCHRCVPQSHLMLFAQWGWLFPALCESSHWE